MAEKHDGKAISDKTTTERAESENAVAKSVSAQQVLTEKVVVEKAVEKKVSITKSTVANVAIESLRRRIPQPRRSLRSRCPRRRASEEAHTNTATVQQDVPKDVGPSAIGRRAKARRILGWRQLANGLQMRRKTHVFRLLRTRSFSA